METIVNADMPESSAPALTMLPFISEVKGNEIRQTVVPRRVIVNKGYKSCFKEMKASSQNLHSISVYFSVPRSYNMV